MVRGRIVGIHNDYQSLRVGVIMKLLQNSWQDVKKWRPSASAQERRGNMVGLSSEDAINQNPNRCLVFRGFAENDEFMDGMALRPGRRCTMRPRVVRLPRSHQDRLGRRAFRTARPVQAYPQ